MAAGSREICGQLLRHRRLVLAVIVAVLMYELVCTEYADVLCRAVVCTLFAAKAVQCHLQHHAAHQGRHMAWCRPPASRCLLSMS